ncbi:MAG: hypothetical protein H7Z14_11215, partial [Anaerolineae bacterium]|nr:hypothetical protein [Phycisphaerae bacterium]
MRDHDQLRELLCARHPCVSITTFEESHALSIVREVAMDAGLNVRLWSVTIGLRDGLIDNAPATPNTDHPAAALTMLARDRAIKQGLIVMLDLCAHLKDERTLRAFREAVDARNAAGDTIILIDQSAEFPAAVRSVVAKLDLSYPDEKELESIVKSALREMNEW